MHDARSVANAILENAWANSVQVTSLALLKVLYFCHAWHLAKFEKPLIGQYFEAWKYGPVCRVVYDQLKYGKDSNIVRSRLTFFDPSKLSYVDAHEEMAKDTEKLIQDVGNYYLRFSAIKLSDLTHQEGSPWHIVWTEAEKRAVPGMIIPNQLIIEWFKRTGGQINGAAYRRAI